MTMADFFEASRGTWLNRRVVHHLDSQDDESADSNLIIQPFDSTDPVVEKVCQVLNISASEANGGARFWWESNLMKEAKNDDYAAVVVDAPNPDDPTKGFLLRDKGYVEKNRSLAPITSQTMGYSPSKPVTTPMLESSAAGLSMTRSGCA